MSHKKSASTTERNKKTWTKNLVRFQESHRKRRTVPLEEQSLEKTAGYHSKFKLSVAICSLEHSSKEGKNV